MIVGLCGAHRTGKTTLAREFAARNDVTFIQTSASRVFASMGLDPAADYPFDVRMDVQERMLELFGAQYTLAGNDYITDRTPIDMMAYTLADVRQETLLPAQDARLQKYLKECLDLTNRTFTILVVVQPGIRAVFEPGKASVTKSYIDHIAHLVMGLVANEALHPQHFYIPKRMTNLNKRVEVLENAILKTVDRHQQMIQSAKEAGSPIVFH